MGKGCKTWNYLLKKKKRNKIRLKWIIDNKKQMIQIIEGIETYEELMETESKTIKKKQKNKIFFLLSLILIINLTLENLIKNKIYLEGRTIMKVFKVHRVISKLKWYSQNINILINDGV